MEIIVQKFGGTSVATQESMKKVIEIIKQNKLCNKKSVIVVSAMGRKGAPYATDTLIQTCKQFSTNLISRELDVLMSCGEIISGVLLCHGLKENSFNSIFLTGGQAGIITDHNFGNAKVLKLDPTRLKEELKKNDVVVVAGFQGVTQDGEITTLGRGGSDTSAVLIGVSLGVKEVDIFTDVDGIMTADPKLTSKAKILEKLEYSEVFQMAEQGAKVIHPRAVEIAQNHGICLNIKNTFNDCKGTKISNRLTGPIDSFMNDLKIATAIAHKNNFCQIKIITDEMNKFSEVLEKIKANKISIDMINFFLDRKTFIVDILEKEKMIQILNDEKLKFEIRENFSKVTVIGHGMNGVPGVMSKIVKSLNNAGVEIFQTSDSHMTISCLINQDKLPKAVESLHDEFGLS